MKKWLALGVSLVLAMAMLAGCGDTSTPTDGTTDPATTGNSAEKEKIVRVTVSGTPVIDPARGLYTSSAQALPNVYDSLVFPVENSEEVEPWLAESWEISEDGTQYTFKLREDVKFHNGDSLTASDVKFSMDRFLTIGEGFAYLFADIVDSTEVVDDYTVKFTLKHAYGPFIKTLPRFWVLNEEQVMANINPDGAYGEYGDYGTDWLITHDAGSGPYVVKELVQQGHLYCEQFTDWWGGEWDANAPEAFKLIDNTEATTVRTMMSSKELEISDMWQSSENLTAMDNLEGVEIATYSPLSHQDLFLNTKRAPFDDVNVRKAVACLIDYEMIIEQLYPGSPLATSPVPVFVGGHVDNVWPYTYDIEAAREYLSQSQYADTIGDYTIEFICNSDVADHEKLALAVQSSAQQIGMKVEVSKTPWISLQELMTQPETTPHLVTVANNAQYNEAGAVLESQYSSKTSGTFENCTWLQDADYDAKVADALATVDQDERYAKYAELQEYLSEDVVCDISLGDTLERVAYQDTYLEWPTAEAAKKGETISNINGYHYYFFDMRVYPDKK